MAKSIHIPLDLPDVRVLGVSQTEQGDWLIQIESTLEGTTCRKCGRSIHHLHGLDQPIQVRHLPVFGQSVYIEFRPKRYRCGHCDGHPTTTQRLSWHDVRSPNTKAYEKWLLGLLVNSTIADVAKRLAISEESVNGVLERWLSVQVDWTTFDELDVVGVDEISLKRGHRHFVVLVTTHSKSSGVKLLAVLPNRKKQTLMNFFASIPSPLKDTIGRVCSDMYDGFVNAAQAELPNAKIVVDRFHVAKAYRKCADTVRKRELKRLKKELSEPEYKHLKSTMWPFRKAPENLSEEEKQRLKRLLSHSPKLQQAYQLRNELTDIFEGDYTKAGAKCAIRAWCKRVRKSDVEEFNSFLKTVDTWLDKITNYFLERLSSGFVEGFNNRAKVLKRRCYGIFNVNRLFQRLTLDINGYEQYGLT
jgi:transposase